VPVPAEVQTKAHTEGILRAGRALADRLLAPMSSQQNASTSSRDGDVKASSSRSRDLSTLKAALSQPGLLTSSLKGHRLLDMIGL
jgi:hypothetical protein